MIVRQTVRTSVQRTIIVSSLISYISDVDSNKDLDPWIVSYLPYTQKVFNNINFCHFRYLR